MAVERRVKPSTRMKQKLSRGRKPIAIASALVAGILVVCLVLTTFGPQLAAIFGNGEHDHDPASSDGNNAEVLRALLAGSVNYEGSWVVNEDMGFQVYIPGTTESTVESTQSYAVYTNSGGTEVYGVTVGTTAFPTLGGDPTQDAGSTLNAVMEAVLNDAGLNLYNTKFSGSYDMGTLTLSDGTKAVRVDGELQTILGLQNEGSTEVVETTLNFPLCGFITLRNDLPVFVWGIVDPDDGHATANLENRMLECAGIFSVVNGG